jgi:hypothetical protein
MDRVRRTIVGMCVFRFYPIGRLCSGPGPAEMAASILAAAARLCQVCNIYRFNKPEFSDIEEQ